MKHQTSSLQLCGQPTVAITWYYLNPVDYQISRKTAGACVPQPRDVDQLKSRMIEEWEHFHQVSSIKRSGSGVHVFQLAFDFEHTDILNTDFRCADV